MIKNILLVGAGGAFGSIARYLLTTIMTHHSICNEWATLLANISGSFLIGLFIPILGNSGLLFMTVGFCGGFTTFSTFSSQAIHLFQNGERITAIAYITASVTLSLLFTVLGIYLAERVIK